MKPHGYQVTAQAPELWDLLGLMLATRSLLCPTYSAPVRAEYADSARTPRGLAGCQHGPDPHTMGARSPYGVCAESELNARTPRTVPNRNSFARTGFQSART